MRRTRAFSGKRFLSTINPVQRQSLSASPSHVSLFKDSVDEKLQVDLIMRPRGAEGQSNAEDDATFKGNVGTKGNVLIIVLSVHATGGGQRDDVR